MAERRDQRGEAVRKVRVWDLPLRLFKWTFAVLIGAAWFTGENGYMERHEQIGIAIIILVLFRVAWGFVGGEHARFRNFVRGPRAVLDYARRLVTQQAPLTPGHNPLGALSVLALLGVAFAQAFTGLFNSDDILFDGPLRSYAPGWFNSLMGSLHYTLFDALLILIGLHIVAVLAYLLMLKNILVPMITGRGYYPVRVEPRDASGGQWWLGAVVAAVVAAVVLGIYRSI